MVSTQTRIIEIIRKWPFVHKLLWKARVKSRVLQRKILLGADIHDINDEIKEAIIKKTPYATGKIGKYEALAVKNYMRRRAAEKQGKMIPPYPDFVMETLHVNAGVFPQSFEAFDGFCEVFVEAIEQCNSMVAWGIEGEIEILKTYGQNLKLSKLTSLEPYYSDNPWSEALEHKKVAVVTPFVESIRLQYQNRQKLWSDPKVLPEMNLVLIRAPFSAGIAPPESENWFSALEKLKRALHEKDPDVVIIGAGAFSLPLAAYAKTLGKVAVHLGGPAQTLFGVLGGRWNSNKRFTNGFINEHWKKPLPSERPESAKKVEGGCYW